MTVDVRSQRCMRERGDACEITTSGGEGDECSCQCTYDSAGKGDGSGGGEAMWLRREDVATGMRGGATVDATVSITVRRGFMRVHDIVATAATKSGSSTDILEDLWHQRLGHVGKTVAQLRKHTDGIIDVLPEKCKGCLEGRMTRRPFKDAKYVHTCKMETIHADLAGPFQTPSVSGKRYVALYTNDATRWTEIYFLAEKSSVPESFREYKAKME